MIRYWVFMLILITVSVVLAVGLSINNSHVTKDSKDSKMLESDKKHIDISLEYDDTHIKKRIANLLTELEIEHIVVWGHPLGSHTHSYIHEAFVKTGKYVGIDTHWVPQLTHHVSNGQIVNYDGPVDNCLFITEGQVIDGMPQSVNSWYLMHNVDRTDTTSIPVERKLSLQFHSTQKSNQIFDKFHTIDDKLNCIYMPWATNLFPPEFEPIVEYENNVHKISVVGQDGYTTIDDFAASLDLTLERKAALTQKEMVDLIRSAKCAPSIMNEWQKQNNYIPCRAMKNISFGQLSVTNSYEFDYMIHHNSITHDDEVELGNMFTEQYTSDESKGKQRIAYKLVKQRHTYLNRLEFILSSFKLKRDALYAEDYFKPKNLSMSLMQSDREGLNVVHLTCHSGTTIHLDFIGRKLGWNLVTINLLMDQKTNSVYNMTSDRADKYWEIYKDQIMNSDVVISSDTAPMSRIVLEHLDEYKGKVIVWTCNRFDYSDNIEEFPDQGWYDLVESTTREHGDRVRMVSYTKIERIYATDMGVFWDGPFADMVLKPIGNELGPIPKQSEIPVHINKSEYLFIPPYLNDEKLIDFKFLDDNGILYYRGRYNGPEDLIGFKAILHIPYAASNLALFENLQRGIPYYIPSISFMKDLLKIHGWFSGGVNRFQYSEWYDINMRHLFAYFDSWEDLKNKINDNYHEPFSKVTKEWYASESESTLRQWSLLTTHWW